MTSFALGCETRAMLIYSGWVPGPICHSSVPPHTKDPGFLLPMQGWLYSILQCSQFWGEAQPLLPTHHVPVEKDPRFS